MRKISYLVLVFAVAFTSCSSDSFKKGEDAMEYKIVESGSGDKVKSGEYMQLHISQYYSTGKKDSLLSDSRDQIPMIDMLDSSRMPPSYYKILSQLRKGDSVVIRVLSDSLIKKDPERMPPFIKKGHMLLTTFKMVNIFKSEAAADSARNAEMAKAQIIQAAKDAAQLKKDDKLLTDYLQKNNITFSKAPKGTYVQIIQQGTGSNIDTSMIVKVNYTGKLLNGSKAFDSNTDSAFSHVEPLLVNMTSDPSLGGPTIAGWNDGLTLLKKGAKAKFFIPSSLAYGSRGRGEEIPTNSILVFDIEVKDVLSKEAAAKEVAIQRKKMEDMQRMQMQMQQMQQQMQQGQQPK